MCTVDNANRGSECILPKQCVFFTSFIPRPVCLKSIRKVCAVNDKSVLFWPVFQPFIIIIFLFERLTKALCFTITQMKMLVKQIAKKWRRKLWNFEPGKFTIQNVHRWNPHDLKRSKIYSLTEKYPILYEIWRGKIVLRNLACRGCRGVKL